MKYYNDPAFLAKLSQKLGDALPAAGAGAAAGAAPAGAAAPAAPEIKVGRRLGSA